MSSKSKPSPSTNPPARSHAGKVVSAASVWVMFLVGISTTCLAPLLVGNVIYVLARIVVPATTLPGTFARFAHVCAVAWLGFGIVFNFVMACSVHPGGIPAVYIDACKSYLAKNPDAALRFCQHCDTPKAPRSHHCVMCGECILKMDHHCPWINGCVGYHNYRYFFGFLLWLLIGTVYSASSCAYMLWFHDRIYHHAFDKVSSETNQVFFIFVLTVAIAITMCLYVGFNLYGICTNQSAVEFHISKEIAAASAQSDGTSALTYFRNPYNVGWLRNAVECLGPETTPWELALPVKSQLLSLVLSSSSSFQDSSFAKLVRAIWLTVPNIQLMPHEGVWFPTNAPNSSA